MISLVMFGSLAALFAIGVPIAFGLGLSSMLTVFVSGSIPPVMLIQKLFSGNDSFPMMCIPFFILAGSIMAHGGMSRRLVDLAAALLGWAPGGLAVVAVLGRTFFGALSGSPVATVAAIGGVLIPSMVEKGYARPFCGALHAAAGPLGGLIPPSLALILYGVSAGESISSLFIATIGPGLLMSLALMSVGGFLAWRKGFGGRLEQREPILNVFMRAVWALSMPVIILGGIYGGVFTPTEAAAVAVVVGFVVGFFIYRELKLSMFKKILVDSAVGTAAVMLIVDFSTVLSAYLTSERIPQSVAEFFLTLTANGAIILLFINVIMLAVGTIMDAAPAIVILTPIFLPLIKTIGCNPVHFGVIVSTNLLIGLATPPVGLTLFMGSRVSGAKVGDVIGEVWPFLATMLLVLLIVNMFPALTLFLL